MKRIAFCLTLGFLFSFCIANTANATLFDLTFTDLETITVADQRGTHDFNILNLTDETWTDFHIDAHSTGVEILDSYNGPGTVDYVMQTTFPQYVDHIDVYGLSFAKNETYSFSFGTMIVGAGLPGILIELTPTTTPIPEPATSLLFLLGLIGMVGAKKKFS